MGILDTFAEIKMSIWDTFSVGSQRAAAERRDILSENTRTTGTVTAVKTCWWIKINTKSVRRHTLDGAAFPHIIYFTYSVHGIAYQGKRCISYHLRCPRKDEPITVFYRKTDPAQYAISLISPSEDEP